MVAAWRQSAGAWNISETNTRARDYRNMRVKRTLPPRTVVKHEGATEGEKIERRTIGGRETGDAR